MAPFTTNWLWRQFPTSVYSQKNAALLFKRQWLRAHLMSGRLLLLLLLLLESLSLMPWLDIVPSLPKPCQP